MIDACKTTHPIRTSVGRFPLDIVLFLYVGSASERAISPFPLWGRPPEHVDMARVFGMGNMYVVYNT